MYTLFIKQLTNHLAGNGRETFQELRECVIVLMGAGGFGYYGGRKERRHLLRSDDDAEADVEE